MLDISPFTKTFNQICYGSDESKVFEDYLDICICCLSGQRYEEEYLSIIKRYSKEKVDLFVTLFSNMVIIMDNHGAGLADCLGEFFQTHITRGAHGQFFTPPHVTDMMAQMTVGEEAKEKTIMDPACGSGRMLLSAAKVSRRNYFFGADLDNRCCKMTAINLCLNGLIGQIAWMNSLTLEHWGGYEIFYDEKRMYVPTVENNISVINFYSLAAGFLTGKYRIKDDLTKSARGSRVEGYLNERGFRILKALDEVAAQYKTTNGAVAIAWLLARPSVTAPIASATTLEQLQELIKSVELKLSSETIALLNKASDWK